LIFSFSKSPLVEIFNLRPKSSGFVIHVLLVSPQIELKKTSPQAPLHRRGELLIFSFSKSPLLKIFNLRPKSSGFVINVLLVSPQIELKKPHPRPLSTGEGSF
jgi:hypothetical protein